MGELEGKQKKTKNTKYKKNRIFCALMGGQQWTATKTREKKKNKKKILNTNY